MKLPLEFQLMHLIIRINESIIKIRRHKFTYKLVLRCLHNRTIKFERKLFKFSLKVLLILVILQYPLSTDTLPHSQRYRQQRITYKTERSLLNPGAALILMDRTYFDLKFKYDINTSFSNGDILRQTFVDYTHRMGLNTKGTIINFEIVKDGVSGLVKKIYSMDITRYTSIFYILKGFGTGDSNYCEMSEELSIIFNKTFIFWPCREKKSNNFLFPSYELIAKGINRIIDQFRWTDAIIVTSDKIVELALAIATNLNVPYYIAIGINSFHSIEILDEIGKVIIFTAAINDLETSKIFPRLQNYKNIRTVLIDVTGVAILNQPNQFLWGLNSSALIFKNKFELNNILVLTTITGKLKMFWQHTLEQSDQIITILENEVVFNDSTIYKRERQSCENVIKENELQDSWDLELESQEISKNNTYSQLIHGDLLLLFYFIAASLFPSLYNTQNMTPELNNFIVLEVFKKYEDQLNSNNLGLVNTNYKKHTTRIRWRPLLLLYNNQPYTEPSFSTHPIYPGYYDWCQKNGQLFEICGYLCWAIVSLFILLSIAVIGLAAVITISIRKYLLKKRLSRGPNKIVLSSSDFVFPIDARRQVDEGIEAMLCCWLQQLQEFGGPEVDKPDLLKGSIGSLKNIGLANLTMTNKNICGSLAKNKAVLSMRARYNGDLVQLKEMSTNTSNELRSKAMDHLILAHGLRHENINPLIGWLCDPNRNAIVFEYCSRGSLQDVLIMDEIKLDWSFRLSLLTDLVRGMRYLHSSPIRFHGSLSSRNCVVDARWVLKITDYGLNVFYDSQGIPQPNKSSKELLWSAPEILRSSKGHFKLGSLQADVYSFGIIMQEVIVRGEPYCMLSLSPDDIIQKLMKPPPLIRPSVSKGAAPPEAINIMRQCWAEAPEMRPDFNLIFERFKQLNHGRKVNFVDTMFQMLEKYSNNLEELIKERTEQLDIERKKTEQLLNRMLPSSVAERLKLGLGVEPEEFSEVTIYFSDIVGFTTIAAHCSPVQVVDLLNDLYTCFDATINAYNVYKVETIGDAYMVVSGLPVIITDHAEQIASMALELLHQSGRFTIKHLPGVPLQLRIGLHTGPCCAGVVGLTMPRYCLFGDTVNTASRMESTGSSWRIHLSETTFNHLEKSGVYYLEPRGPIEIKGKGKMKTFWLLGKKGFEKSLPTPPPYGLSDALIKNSSRIIASTPTTSANQSSSQSSLLAVEVMNVKVEITPPIIDESNQILSSTPPDSNLHLNLSSCMNDIKMQITGPQQRKFSDLPSEVLLNPSSFRQFSLSPALGSTANSSLKLYKRIEDMMDLSSPYNHYKCLSPSESNLTQCSEGKYLYGLTVKVDGKPGSSKSLRRQFSLDKDNCSQQQSMGDIAVKKNEDPTTTTPSPTKTTFTLSRSHKPNSLSVAQDLDKIVEIPASPKCLLNNQKSSSPVTLSMIEPMSNSIYGTSSICTNKIINLQLNDEETNSTIFQQEKHYIV